MKEVIYKIILSITTITATAYLLSYIYNFGLFHYFKIDKSLIFFEDISSFINVASTLLIIVFPFLGIFLLLSLYNNNVDSQFNEIEKMIINKILKSNFLTTEFEFKIFKYNIRFNMLKIIYLIAGPFLLLIALFSIYYVLLSMKFIESIKLSFMYSLIDSIVVLFYNVWWKYLKINFDKKFFKSLIGIAIIISIISIFLGIGFDNGKQRKEFLLNNEYILIYNTSEYGIGCKYEIDEDTNTVIIDTSKYVKMDINGLVLENKSFEKVSIKNMK